MSTDCVITFDHPNGIYNSGENINGHVKLQTEKPKSIRAISITIIGYGDVHWSESHGKSSTKYSSHEQFLNSVTYVAGSAQGESFDLEPGTYEYTFICHLPIELPTTMKETFGKIKYKVIVTIDRRLRFDNVFKKDFFVHQILDLNVEHQHNKLPKRVPGMKKIAPLFGLCCYNQAAIKAELLIPCSGFVVGQLLPFQLIVHNDTNIDLSRVQVKLMKCYVYTSSSPRVKKKETEVTIQTRECGNILRHTNKEFNYDFLVPYLPPTSSTQYIAIDYKLKAKINVFGYAFKNFFLEIPITIGTIPLNDSDLKTNKFDF